MRKTTGGVLLLAPTIFTHKYDDYRQPQHPPPSNQTQMAPTTTPPPPPATNDRIRYVQSVRGNTVIELNDQIFTLNQRKHGTHYWECVKKRNKTVKCNARIVTTADGHVKSVRGVHNHRLRTVQPPPEPAPSPDAQPECGIEVDSMPTADREELDLLDGFL